MVTTAPSRRTAIIDVVLQRGFVSVEDLAERFGVTAQTIRRDVNALDKEGQLSRHHGGAAAPLSGRDVGYVTRQVLQHDEKRRIARLIATHVPDGASVMLTIGTTTEEVAKALTNHRGLRVITNTLNVVQALSRSEECEIILTGGLVRNYDGGLVGEATLDMINQFYVDIAIMGISGIDLDGTLLDYDYREVRVSRAILRNARRVFLAADHSKFGRPAMVRLGALCDVHALFTDRPPPEQIVQELADRGVALHVAGVTSESIATS